MDGFYLLGYIGQGLERERRIERSLKINLDRVETRSNIQLALIIKNSCCSVIQPKSGFVIHNFLTLHLLFVLQVSLWIRMGLCTLWMPP